MKSNTFFKLFIIILLGLIFRLTCLDKPEGLWNDEYVSWYIATQYNLNDEIRAIFQNCHMPIYYLYLKIWLLFAPDTDISLRYSSIIPSIFSIYIMYLCGKELNNKKVGILAALLTSISSFCIYFSQEVRLYSLVFLITSAILYFFIKSINETNAKNISKYFILNLLLCATHTLGIIFSFFNILFFLYLLFSQENLNTEYSKFIKSNIKFIFPFVIGLSILFPLMYSIATSDNLSQFWSTFTPSKIFFVLSDYFSPIQINIINTPKSLFDYLIINNKINYSFLVFCIIPTILATYILCNIVKIKNKTINLLITSTLLFLLSIIILAILGKLVLVTKYTIEIYPILLLSLAFCIEKFKKDKVIKIIFITYIILNISYLLFAPNSAPKLQRTEGNRAVIDLINYSRLTYDDYLILTYYDKDKFIRYEDLDEKFNVLSINKHNFNRILFHKVNYYEILKNGKTKYKDTFIQLPNNQIIKYIDNNVNSKIKKGQRVGIIFLNNVSFLTKDNLDDIVNNDKKYKDTSIIFLAFSSLRNNLLYKFRQDYKLDSMTTAGDWTLFVFEKE